MITSIKGVLTEAGPLRVTVETGGLGYEVHVPVTTAERLPQVGSAVKLHTHAVYREDSQTLYGFAAPEDRDFFRLMIDHVSGVGPKVALSIMSRLSLTSLEQAISSGDVATLARCPGIGKKTAERLVIELKAKVAPGGTAATARPPASGSMGGAQADAIAALIALGYKASDADTAVRHAVIAIGPSATTEALIKKALS